MIINGILRYVKLSLGYFKSGGFKLAFRQIANKIKKDKKFDYSGISVEKRKQQQSTKFNKDIKFSILVPLFNTPQKYLKEMILSVLAQTYGNFELCLADGSDDKHSYVKETVAEFSRFDERIIYKKLQINGGISQNTNECLKMATGNYISLLDHDDILHPSALFETMKAICEKNADFIYTDEVAFVGDDLSEISVFHFKPDFSPDNLRANNYICHFSSFSEKLIELTGGFRSEFDGSQDHDLILRLTDAAKNICHIPKILYFWRSHQGSVAAGIEAKSYAVDAGIKAVKANIEDSGQKCDVSSIDAFPSVYRISYKFSEHPFVSVIIPITDGSVDIGGLLKTIYKNASYANFEVICAVSKRLNGKIAGCNETDSAVSNFKIIYFDSESEIELLNDAAELAGGDFLLLLNQKTIDLSDRWISELLMYAMRDEVGATGGFIRFKDLSLKFAGTVLGLGEQGIAGSPFFRYPADSIGYMGKLLYAQNITAVSSDCMAVRRSLFTKIGGFDTSFGKYLSSADFCLKLQNYGKLAVITPFAATVVSCKKEKDFDNFKKEEADLFKKRWNNEILKGDPYYNPNFSLKWDYDINFSRLQLDCCD